MFIFINTIVYNALLQLFSYAIKYLIFILILLFNILSLILNDWKVTMNWLPHGILYYAISVISFV